MTNLNDLDVTIVQCSDWVGIYSYGKLIDEGHSLDVGRVLDALKIRYKSVEANEVWLWHEDGLPEQLTGVVTSDQEYDDCECEPGADHT